jgi:hypothetical protein
MAPPLWNVAVGFLCFSTAAQSQSVSTECLTAYVTFQPWALSNIEVFMEEVCNQGSESNTTVANLMQICDPMGTVGMGTEAVNPYEVALGWANTCSPCEMAFTGYLMWNATGGEVTAEKLCNTEDELNMTMQNILEQCTPGYTFDQSLGGGQPYEWAMSMSSICGPCQLSWEMITTSADGCPALWDLCGEKPTCNELFTHLTTECMDEFVPSPDGSESWHPLSSYLASPMEWMEAGNCDKFYEPCSQSVEVDWGDCGGDDFEANMGDTPRHGHKCRI